MIRGLPADSIASTPDAISPRMLYPADRPDFMFKRLIAFATVLVSLILLGMVAGR